MKDINNLNVEEFIGKKNKKSSLLGNQQKCFVQIMILLKNLAKKS